MNGIPTYRASQAARILSVSTETLRTWDSQGRLPFEVERTPGGQRLYPAASVNALAEAQREGRMALLAPRMEEAIGVPTTSTSATPAPANDDTPAERPAWIDGPKLDRLPARDALVIAGHRPARNLYNQNYHGPDAPYFATGTLAHDSAGRPQIDVVRDKNSQGWLRIRFGMLDGPNAGQICTLHLELANYSNLPVIAPRTTSLLRRLMDNWDDRIGLTFPCLHERLRSATYMLKVANHEWRGVAGPTVQYVNERVEASDGGGELVSFTEVLESSAAPA